MIFAKLCTTWLVRVTYVSFCDLSFVFPVSVSEVEALFELFKSISSSVIDDGLINKVIHISINCYFFFIATFMRQRKYKLFFLFYIDAPISDISFVLYDFSLLTGRISTSFVQKQKERESLCKQGMLLLYYRLFCNFFVILFIVICHVYGVLIYVFYVI